jgi:hypothetical protein
MPRTWPWHAGQAAEVVRGTVELELESGSGTSAGRGMTGGVSL